jgi:predicted nucleotidyltransferase
MRDSILSSSATPGREGVSTDRLFKFLTSGPLERITATQTEMIVDNLDPNEDAQLFHDWVMGAAIGWVSEPATRDHWHRFPGIKLNEIDWHALSDRLRANFGWPVLRQQTTEPGGPPHPDGEQHGEDDQAHGHGPTKSAAARRYYHGTPARNADSIKRDGLRGPVYLATTPDEAEAFANLETQMGEGVVVFEVLVPDAARLEPDLNAEQDENHAGKGSVVYPGDLPPSSIVREAAANHKRFANTDQDGRLSACCAAHPLDKKEEYANYLINFKLIHAEMDGRLAAARSCGRSAGWHRAGRCTDPECIERKAAERETIELPKSHVREDLKRFDRIEDEVQELKKDDERALGEKSATQQNDEHQTPNVRHWPVDDGELWALVTPDFDPQSADQNFYATGNWDSPLPKGMFSYLLITGNTAGLAATDPAYRQQGLMQKLILAALQEHDHLVMEDTEPGMRSLLNRMLSDGLIQEHEGEMRRFDSGNDLVIRLATLRARWLSRAAAADPFRQAILDWVEFKRRDEPSTNQFRIKAHELFNQIKGADLSSWGPFARAIKDLIDENVIDKISKGTDWILIHDRRKNGGVGAAQKKVPDANPVPPQAFNQEAGRLISFIANELRKSPLTPDELGMKAVESSRWPYDANFVTVYEYALNRLERDGEIEFNEARNQWGMKPVAPTDLSQVNTMSEGDRQQKVDALLERWQSEPGARPQIEQQLKSLRALRALFLVRRAEKDQLWAPDPEIVKNTWRRYQCTVCGHVQAETTNHLGAIMSYCKKCSWAPSKGECYNPMGDGRCYRKFTYLGEIDERHQDESGFWDSSSEAWTRRGDAYDPTSKKKEKVVVKRSPVEVLAQAGFSDPQMLIGDLWTAFTKSGAREHRDHQITSVHLTGSRWKGDARDDSDLDVVVFHSGNALMSEANQAFRAKVAEITGGVVDAFLLPQSEPWDHPMSGNIMGLTASSTSNFFRAGERQRPLLSIWLEKVAARPMRDLGPALDKARNMFGPLSPEIRKRILNFLQNPTTDSWDDIQSIIISGFGTIWQAMIQIDPSFPRSGRRTDQAGNVVQDWERIPTPEQVLLVLQKNTGGERQSLLSSWNQRRAGGTDWALVEKLMKAYWDGRVAEDWAGGLDCTGDSEALADHLFAAEMEPEHISSYYRDANGNLWSHDWLQLDGKVIDITHSQFGAPDYLITNVGDPRYPSMDELADEETARANPSGQMPTASLLARWFSRRAEGADPASGPFNAPWPDQIQAFMQAVYDQTAGHPFTRGQRVWNDSVIVEVHPWRGGPDPEYPWIITLKWLQSMDPRKGRARECLAWLTALADEYGVPLDLHAKPTGEPRIPKPALKNLYKDQGFERDRTQGPDDMVRHPLVAAWRARRAAQAETQIGTITYRGQEVPVMMPTKDIDQWLKLRTDDRIIHDAAVGQQFTELVGRLYTYAAMKIEPNANIRESQNISLYPDIERALDYFGYGRDEANQKLQEPGGEDRLKQAAFSMFEQQRADLMSPQQAADLLMNMAVVLHKDMGMTMDEAKARLSSLIIEWGGGGPENLHLNSLTQKWRERRAANSEQKLLRELRCTAIGSDSGTENEAVLPKGAVVGVQPHSNDHTIFFYSPIYSKIIVRGRVMKTNQYSAPVQEFRAATDIGYGEGTGYKHGPECFCDECMANDDMSTRRCPTCGSRECPGDGHSIDCRKPGTMTLKDVPTETKDSLLDKFNRGEIDEKTLRRRMKQISSSLLSRWHRRAGDDQAALIHQVLGQINEDEIAGSGIAQKVTDFVWTLTRINPRDTNFGKDPIEDTKQWLDEESADYLADMGEPRLKGGARAQRREIEANPVVVIRGDDGVLWVMDGNHRTAQAMVLGMDSIPALVGVKKPGVGRTPINPDYKMGSMFERWVMRQANDPLKKIIEINGVKVGIEWPKGSTRTWKHLPGNDYEKLMKADYGYIRQTEGEDGEEIDVYAGPDRDSDLAFVVTQLDKKTGEYDEDKIMLGYSSEAEAKASYLEHMEKAHFGGIKKMSWDEFLKLVPKSQRVKEKTAAMVDDPGSQMVLTDDLRVWERASKGQGDHVDSFVLPKGTTVKVLKKFRLNHGGSPELLKITFWPPKGKAGAGLPTRGSGVVRADDLRFVVSGGVVGQVPEQSIPSNPKMIENHIVDLLRKGPSTISRDLSELIGEGKGVMLDENGEVADFDRPFADMVQQVIGQMLDRGVIRFDGGTAEFSLLKDPEPTSVEHVPTMNQGDVQSKIDSLLDQLALEQDPAKKQQIEQRIRSLSAGIKDIWRRRAGETTAIHEQRSPGAVQECSHEWPGKKPGERGWCGRCRL